MTVLGFLYDRRQRLIEAQRHQSRLGDDARCLLALGEDDILKVGEIICGLPGCADVDTVFLVMRQGRRTEAMKITRRMADITRADLEAAVAAFAERTGGGIGPT